MREQEGSASQFISFAMRSTAVCKHTGRFNSEAVRLRLQTQRLFLNGSNIFVSSSFYRLETFWSDSLLLKETFGIVFLPHKTMSS